MSVKPVPDGMHTISPHLTCRDCAKAIDWYVKAFRATPLARMDGPDGRIMHAAIRIGDSILYLNDEFLEMGAKSPKTIGGTGVTINYYSADSDDIWKAAVDAGAEVKMPYDDQFWGDRYGIVEDPYGHSWAIARRIANYTPDELRKRGQEAMAQMGQGKN